jgi:hypothetical protein
MTLLERLGLSPKVAPPPEMDAQFGYERIVPYDVTLADGDIIDIGTNVRIRCVGKQLRVMARGNDNAPRGCPERRAQI